MTSSSPFTASATLFTSEAKHALLAIESSEDRVETILFLLQTAINDRPSPSVIRCSDVRSAQLMVELRIHMLEGI
jgi:hypothetical protein